MKEAADKIWKKCRMSLFLAVIAMVAAGCVELIYNLPMLLGNDSTRTYELEELRVTGMDQEEEKLVTTEQAGEIHLYPQDEYIDKLGYSFLCETEGTMLNATINVYTYDAYGNDTVKTITDNNPYVNNESIVNIKAKVKEICISLPENSSGVEISNIYTKNKPQFVGMRWLFFATLFASALLIWKNRTAFVGKVERIFLLIGLTAGTMLVIIMPLNKVGFDEEVHFRTAYNIKLSSSVSSTPAIEELKYVTLSNWPYNIAQSKEERELMEAYYQEAGDYTKNGSTAMKVPTEITMVGEYNFVFMGLGIKLGKLLHLPFTAVFTLGRLFNMWSYLALIYFAIKRLPIGKYIMAVVALLPTPMFQAAVYSYDAVVTGFLYLGLAYLIAELVEKEKKITIKNGVILLGALSFGMMPKAIYVPLVALGFLIPKEKFENKKQKIVFRTANVICILGLLATFVLPMLFAPERLGDVRGGNISVSGQLSNILSHPLGYLKVWFDSMGQHFWSYSFGEGAFGNLGHLAISTCVPMIGLLLIFTIITDNINRSDMDLTIRQKCAMGLAAALSVAFVWGALYLSFNEVGATYIGGVQGRYFIPLLFIFYLLMRRKNIKNTMNPLYYNYVVFGCSMFIMYKTVYDCILQPYCF